MYCYEWKNRRPPGFPFIWRFIAESACLPHNKPTIFSLSCQGLTLPRIWRRLLWSFVSFSPPPSLWFEAEGGFGADPEREIQITYRRRGALPQFLSSFLSFDNEANEGAICQPPTLLKANNETEQHTTEMLLWIRYKSFSLYNTK